ncbi:hypothetical protein PT276_02750 [Orbaceae bacterium ESL0721]|nr:hypothetical protein [Orbaceae bacterium ESL0721]
MKNKKLHENYRNYVFRKDDLQDCLEIDIDINKNIPEFYAPYSSRVMLSIWEVSGIIARNDPEPELHDDLVQSYRKTIVDAIKHDYLKAENIEYTGGDIFSADLYKNEVGQWAKNLNYNWPFPVEEDANENNNNLQQRINQLEQDLVEQTKINDGTAIISLKIALNDSKEQNNKLESEINQLKANNNNLTEQLAKAKKDIEELKKNVPILLGTYRTDDPLLLAIQIRNKEWANYDESNKRTRPTQDAIIADLKENHNVGTDQLAKAIELVSCPIYRSK